jgi:hypothetical protein
VKFSMKSQATLALHSRITFSSSADFPILNSIIFLLAAALMSHDGAEADIHGQTLSRLIQQKAQSGPQGFSVVDLSVLSRSIFYDSHNSLDNLKRTNFDLDGWVQGLVAPFFKPMDELLSPYRPHFDSPLNHTLHQEPLRTIVINYRLASWVWTSSSPLPNMNGPLAALWVIGHNNISRGRLVNHYVTTKEVLEHTPDSVPDERRYYMVQGVLALALLVYMIPLGGQPMINGRYLFRGPAVVTQRLEEELGYVIETACAESSQSQENHPSMWTQYADALLWAAFVGAQREHMLTLMAKRFPSITAPVQKPMNRLFAQQAHFMGLRTWSTIEEKLRAFLYYALVPPQGLMWVEKSLHAFIAES